ncbi:aspartate aminotransferase family protein [Candidatus Litorirhabdus singularis]|nr:aspartate aminotransferase family protein [Candidatus Litorirhabdus singularis]
MATTNDTASTAIMNTYGRLPVTFTHGEGIYLYADDGRRYFDAIAGIGVNSLGHAHPAVTRAITEQAGKLIHTSNLYHIELQQQLAEKLTRAAGMETCFFGNSGAEANEAAIKLARLYGHQKGVKKPAVIVMENSFHGRTMATLSATGNRKIQAGFEPLVQGFVRAPYDNIEALTNIAENNADVVAILVEPIQGEGGVRVPADGYLSELRQLCDARGWLLMLDEVQSGNCRSGHWFACQGEDVTPDVLTTAKALANGVPIGACLASGPAASVLAPGNHGSTYGGNPLACAAALAVMETMASEQLAQRAGTLGSQIREQFAQQLADVDLVIDIRGRGLMLGIELSVPCPELVSMALNSGYLINVTAGSTVRLLPPLIMSDAQAAELVTAISGLIREFAAQHVTAAAS